jgi:hypothetical protein
VPISANATLDESRLFLNIILNPLKLSTDFKFYFNCCREHDVTLIYSPHAKKLPSAFYTSPRLKQSGWWCCMFEIKRT